jgi:hypothetical protein
MFQSENKSTNNIRNEKTNSTEGNYPEINYAEMLHEQRKAMIKNSVPAQRMAEDEEKVLQEKTDLKTKNHDKRGLTQREIAQKKSNPENVEEIKKEQVSHETRTPKKNNQIQKKTGISSSDNNTLTAGSKSMMSENVQEKMEKSFGTSFGGVGIHQNDTSASDIGAKAYTKGENIHFAPGYYNPESQKGQELLGHELTHVVQQRQGLVSETKQSRGVSVNDSPTLEKEADDLGKKAANNQFAGHQFKTTENKNRNTIQKKIIVDGNDYTPQESYKKWLIKNYSEEMVEFIMSMHNDGNPPDYNFDSYEQMGREVQVRYYAIQGMGEANNGSTNYGVTGKLNTTYWEKVGPYHFQVKSGAVPSEAIESIFDTAENNVLECNSMMVAIQYRAILKALGTKKFNEKFPNGSGILISPHHQPKVLSKHPIWEKKLFKRVSISSSADLLPGDWVYFKNMDDYIDKHPGGLWSGEHTMYLGNGKFRGFGTLELTEQGMLDELMKYYNSGLQDSEKITDTDQLPGLRNYARRPVISEIEK